MKHIAGEIAGGLGIGFGIERGAEFIKEQIAQIGEAVHHQIEDVAQLCALLRASRH